MKVSPIQAIVLALISLSLPACRMHKEEQSHEEHQTIVLTSPTAKDVLITQPYVCQIHSRQHIEVRALESGYLQEILVKEGQSVKKDEPMFRILPILQKAKYEADKAEFDLAGLELKYTEDLYKKKAVSENEVALYKAKLARAKAKMELARAELKFTEVTAPFDGIVDRQLEQIGSLIKERDMLTTLSDNSVMWVYFNVPEAKYLEYKAHVSQAEEAPRYELKLANGSKFQYLATNITIEGQFDNETGNIPFRADFPNPHGLLRYGQTGTVLILQTLKNAVVIPQRATFEILDKRYVYVIGEDNAAHQRPITIQHELEDIFVIESGLDLNDKIVLEGVQQVHDGQKVEDAEFQKPGETLAHQKYHAE